MDIAIVRTATLSYEALDPLLQDFWYAYDWGRIGSLWYEWTAPRDGYHQDLVLAPGGRFLALADGTSSIRLYDFPFRPVWWMRLIAGLVILAMAELLARIMLLIVRPFVPDRRSTARAEPAGAAQNGGRDPGLDAGEDRS